jgi:GT2 family glycosyltransferase
MRWVIGLVNFNSELHTTACIESVLRAKDARNDVTIVVVDNSSTFESEDDKVIVLDPGRNLGYAGAVNLISHVAREGQFDALWVLNNDCTIRSDALAVYATAIEGSNADIYTSVTALGDSDTVWYGGGVVDTRSGRCMHLGYGENVESFSFEGTRSTGWASGANIVIPQRTLKQSGDWSQRLFLYLEELEWQLRAGYAVELVGSCLVSHDAGSTTRAVSGNLEFVFSARNRILCINALPDFLWYIWICHWIVDFIIRPSFHREFRKLMLAAVCPISTALSGPAVVRLVKLIGG